MVLSLRFAFVSFNLSAFHEQFVYLLLNCQVFSQGQVMNLRAYFTNEPTWAEKFLQGERPTPPKNPIKPQIFPSRPITEITTISAEIGAKLYMPEYLPKRYPSPNSQRGAD
jgi:hypothetical protein